MGSVRIRNRCILLQKRVKVSKLLNFQQSRDEISGKKPPRSARLAASEARLTPAKPGLPDEVRHQTRVSPRDCEKWAAFGFGTVAFRCGSA
jgi:hypothetical protein